jgi:hypothetical protein
MGENEGKSPGSKTGAVKSILDTVGPSKEDPSLPAAPPDDGFPERYVIREDEDQNFLVCREAPNIRVSVQRGLSVSASSAVKYDSGTIFLDGAAQGPPFLDSERDLYNLDHHEGCVRLFTVSTCEQAYILLRKGLNLREREWRVLANDPDLDTVLAIWLLANHKRVTSSDEGEILRKLIPLVRLQGLIDVYGMDLKELSCLPHNLLEETENRIGKLRAREVQLKKEGAWEKVDFTEYTLRVLEEIDRMIYSPWQFSDFQIVDELARVKIGEKSIAVVCRSELGIYEVEEQLKSLHDKRLGIIVLQRSEKDYTLKQVDLFLPTNLQRIYSVLNLRDRFVTKTNRWGGSDIIGGSPRRTGTALQQEEIAAAIAGVFQKPAASQILSRLAVASIAVLACLIGGWTLTLFWSKSAEAFVTGFTAFSAICLLLFAQPYHRMYGVRAPVGRDWGFLFVLTVIGAALGGTWFPAAVERGVMQAHLLTFMLAVLLPFSAELLFRGVIHGLLAENLSTQRAGGRWFISWPVILSSLFYVGVSFLEVIPRRSGIFVLPWMPALDGVSQVALSSVGLVLFGIACGVARERSESLAAPILFHWLAVGLVAIWVLS